jgi:Na+-transporting methylmalonyl-CoA/oxaloacetate decarboxylase gamma subunit
VPPPFDAEHPGYETTDVRVGGIAVFLAGLFGVVIIFFFFCYGMGKVINNFFIKQDGAPTKWAIEAGATPPGGKREDLTSNAELQQRELRAMTATFPQPRLDIDDGEQATADLHAREDLLLDHYSTVDGQPGTIRIPIERAMELIAQRGLPVEAQAAGTPDLVAHAAKPEVQAPLTTGFARTGFELTVIEARKQKLEYGKAEAENAEPK